MSNFEQGARSTAVVLGIDAQAAGRPRADLARLADRLPVGPAWSYEVKWDGYRCLALKVGDAVTLRARTGDGGVREFARRRLWIRVNRSSGVHPVGVLSVMPEAKRVAGTCRPPRAVLITVLLSAA
jgi:hypothetical protein